MSQFLKRDEGSFRDPTSRVFTYKDKILRQVDKNAFENFEFVNQIFPNQETMISGVLEIAKEIASKTPLAVYGCKRLINYSKDHSTAATLDYISIWNASMMQGEEMQEAMQSRAEKRKGDFTELPKRRGTFGSD